MFERFKLLTGAGNPTAYGNVSAAWRLALTAAQVVFVVLLLLEP